MKPLHLVVGVLWLATVSYGMRVLWDYEYGAGRPANAPATWPAETPLTRTPGRATLVMLVHPHCPCSRASIGELARLVAHTQGRLTAHVLFLKPTDAPDGWETTDLWQSAAVIPGVTVTKDADGIEARRFGAATSGQVVLYDPAGHLVFAGGITGSRGHAGDNAGSDAIVALLDGGPAPAATPVFGCALAREIS